MDNSNLASEITIPEAWHPTNDWDSHRPMLYLASLFAFGNIAELGCGPGSTPLLHGAWQANIECSQPFQFASLETNPEYAKLFPYTELVSHYGEALYYQPFGLLFVDCAPGEIRKDLIEKFANDAQIIVVHDTEPGAEYVYGMGKVLNSFKYRCDLIIEGMPQTTAVSNTYDFILWKGVYNDKFNFV